MKRLKGETSSRGETTKGQTSLGRNDSDPYSLAFSSTSKFNQSQTFEYLLREHNQPDALGCNRYKQQCLCCEKWRLWPRLNTLASAV